MKNLIKLRNKLLNTYSDLEKLIENSQFYLRYTREDVISFFELFGQIKDTKYFTFHYIWDIPKKTHNNEYYEEGELTE